MKNIKTLYITNLGLMDNLAATQILPYLEGLAGKGINISILSFEKKHNLKNKKLLNKLDEGLHALGIEWERHVYHNRWGNLIDIFVGFIRAWRMIKERGIAIIHARASIPIIIAWPLSRLSRCKIIYDRRGTMKGDFIDDVNIGNIFSIKIFSNLLDTLEKYIMRHSDAIVVLSKKALEALERDPIFAKKRPIIETIPCCTDLNRFSKQLVYSKEVNAINLNNKFVISYIGSLGTCYLLEEMARFYKIMKRRAENAFFLIISHTERRYIDGVLKKENIHEGPDYAIISADPDGIPVYIGMSDCTIMFIKSVDCKIGSSPTKFAESLAAGVPVIANRGIGDIEDIILTRKVGVLVDDLNEYAYEKAIERLTALLKEREILRKRCIETAELLFSLPLGIKKYTEIYEKLKGEL